MILIELPWRAVFFQRIVLLLSGFKVLDSKSHFSLEIPYSLLTLRSREYRLTHMNCFTVDIPFLSEALVGEIIWVILKVANLMMKVWWLWQEEKEKKEKKLVELPSQGIEPGSPAWKARALTTIPMRIDDKSEKYFTTYIM